MGERLFIIQLHFGGHLVHTVKGIKLFKVQDKLGQSSLHRAAQYGHLKYVEALLSLDEETINVVDNAKRTPLCRAAWNGDVAVVNFLISKKAQVHHWDLWKQTPFILAARNGKVGAFKIPLKALLDSSSTEDIFHLDNSGKSAIFWAKEEAKGQPNKHISAFYRVMTGEKVNVPEDLSQLYESHIEMASNLAQVS